ncbi:MAG: hypothetical protein HY275_05765 [Gemmatimonadetes bacterium]|nr:hypothetical protein [Gemmatimonadota bacterium]
MDNSHLESFHDNDSDECLSFHWIVNLPDARHLSAAWREGCNTVGAYRVLRNRLWAEFALLCELDHGLEPALTPQPHQLARSGSKPTSIRAFQTTRDAIEHGLLRGLPPTVNRSSALSSGCLARINVATFRHSAKEHLAN